ncbi:MAG: metallophosphoesterase [Woeseiaceae bacterium]|nr:metallophosphoesterase [Woeseiaceae bacterium]
MNDHEVRANSAAVTSARLLHLTDLHLFADADGELRGVNSLASLTAVCRAFLDSGYEADAALVTGDLIQDDSREAYVRCREALQALDLPIQLCPGNHDVRDLMRSELGVPGFEYCATLDAGSWTVVSIDSCVSGRAGGRIGDEEYERLRHLLATAANKHVLICLHHPPVELGSRWLDSVGLDDGDRLIDLAAESGNVRGMLFGHAHQVFDETVRGIRLMCTPSTCRQFKPGSDDFAVDDLPPAYRILELQDDGSIETNIHWVSHA